MVCLNSSSGIPTFLRYRKPTSSKACRRSERNAGLVVGSLARAMSRIGIDVKDILGGGRGNTFDQGMESSENELLETPPDVLRASQFRSQYHAYAKLNDMKGRTTPV